MSTTVIEGGVKPAGTLPVTAFGGTVTSITPNPEQVSRQVTVVDDNVVYKKIVVAPTGYTVTGNGITASLGSAGPENVAGIDMSDLKVTSVGPGASEQGATGTITLEWFPATPGG